MRWPSTPDLVTGIGCAELSGGPLDNHPNFLKERHGSKLDIKRGPGKRVTGDTIEPESLWGNRLLTPSNRWVESAFSYPWLTPTLRTALRLLPVTAQGRSNRTEPSLRQPVILENLFAVRLIDWLRRQGDFLFYRLTFHDLQALPYTLDSRRRINERRG
jgi:hypothetical protein